MPTHTASTAARLSVAPMMDWTDRHCRMFHRQFSKRALLYTEMITSAALVRGGAAYLLDYDAAEHPVALQLGGSDPQELAQATALAVPFGYDEINLNVGCPSDRVQSGCFGAVLMRDPALVADICSAMIDAAGDTPVTVKCRIGVDEQDPQVVLPNFIETVAAAGIRQVTVHARKAWLKGLNPKENREIPPLDYPLVLQIARAFPQLSISLNGGISSLDDAVAHLASGIDGIMIGRAAYYHPAEILGAADQHVFGEDAPATPAETAVRAMLPYIEAQMSLGVPIHHVTRHMLGAFSGRRGARAWRRTLSDGAHKAGAGPELVEAALEHLSEQAA